jgi:chromosome segregation ATPase
MAEFAKIEEIQHTDEERANEKFLDAKILNASEQLRLLESQEGRLNSELSTLAQKNTAIKATLCDAPDTVGLAPPLSMRTGTFFQQLRNLEAQIETRENEKSGLRAVIHSLQAEIGSFAARNRRLLQTLTQLREQNSALLAQESSRQREVESLQRKLQSLVEERDFLQGVCEETKAKILARVTEMRETSPEEISRLVAERSGLESLLREETKKLERLQNDERGSSSRLAAQNARRKKDMERTMSANEWVSERAALLAKVKKARQELGLLGSRERGAAKATQDVQNKMEGLSYDQEEVKAAIVAETISTPLAPSKFLADALATEKRYEQKLRRQVDELASLEKTVAQFKAEHAEVVACDEEIAAKGRRIALLTEELRELRVKI